MILGQALGDRIRPTSAEESKAECRMCVARTVAALHARYGRAGFTPLMLTMALHDAFAREAFPCVTPAARAFHVLYMDGFIGPTAVAGKYGVTARGRKWLVQKLGTVRPGTPVA